MKKQRYDVLSPDGFSIRREGDFPSEKAREKYFLKWMKRFEHQGYYSSVNGRIPLDELREHCQFIIVEP